MGSYAPIIKINSNIKKPLNILMRETIQKLIEEAEAYPDTIPIIVPKNIQEANNG